MPHEPQRDRVKTLQQSEIGRMGQGSDGDGEAREEATEDEDEKTAELQTSKETDEHRSNEARSEHSASNTANLFSKTDTNENLCNKNTPSPPATI